MIDNTSPRRRIASFLLAVAVIASAALVGVAASEYAVSTGSETDTPERTVEIEGSEYSISSISTAPVDGSLSASIDVPDGTSWLLDIYNDDEQAVVDSHYGSGPRTESIDLSSVDPGTYAIVLQVDGSIVEVKPLVVEGVSVSLSVPGEVETGESLTATVETNSIDGETMPQNVEVAVWNGDETIRVDTTETGDGAYEATVDDLAAGDYQVYAAAQGSGTVMGEPNAIGVSDGASVIVSADDGGGDPGTPGGPGDGDDRDDGDDSDEEPTNSTDDGSTDGGSDNEIDGSDGGDTDDEDGNDSDTGPQTPTEPETNDGDGDSDTVPFAGPAVLVVSLSLVVGGALHRRLRGD